MKKIKTDSLLESFKKQSTEINLSKIYGGLMASAYQKYAATTDGHAQCCPDSKLTWFNDDGTKA